MGQQEIILDLPAEAQGLLADNGVELISALRKAGLNVQRGSFPTGVPLPEGGKEPVLTILAIGVTVQLVAAGIAKILDALGRNRKFLVTERRLAPVEASDGRPVRDANGDPVLFWSERAQLLEAMQTAQDRSSTGFTFRTGPVLLKFSASSGK
jgi:hypothetical protein